MAWMMGGTIGATVMLVAVRHVSAELHPFEIAFFRSFLGVLVLFPWFLRDGLALLRTQRLGLHALRATFNLFAMLAFFYAVSIVPLARVTSLGFTAPLWATLLAVLLLGEVVRLRRWTAILCGFAGTIVILRPGVDAVDLGSVLVLGSAFVWACAVIVIKVLSRSDSAVTITSYMVLLMAPLSLVPALFVWQWPSASQLLWLTFIGVSGTLAQLMMTQALKEADTSVVMPVDFLKLIWAAMLGYLFFAEVPSLYTWAGAAVIFASASYVAYRERKVTRVPARQSVGRPPAH